MIKTSLRTSSIKHKSKERLTTPISIAKIGKTLQQNNKNNRLREGHSSYSAILLLLLLYFWCCLKQVRMHTDNSWMASHLGRYCQGETFGSALPPPPSSPPFLCLMSFLLQPSQFILLATGYTGLLNQIGKLRTIEQENDTLTNYWHLQWI